MDKVLILGGTNFIGRNLVEALLKVDRFDITLFNRGQSGPNLFPQLKKIQGDRNTSDIDKISSENWDYIIDLSCFFPDSLSNTISQVNSSIKRYIFISTCSVYDNTINKAILRNEEAPTLPCSSIESIDTSDATYGNRKAKCERVLQATGMRYSIFRPALVYGPYDSTDRFYYWLYQVNKAKQLLIPNGGQSTFSVTYVKDLVQAIIKSLNAHDESNIYNAVSNPQMSISKLIEVVSELTNQHPKLTSADPKSLNDNEIEQWEDIPLWLDCDYYTYSNERALRDLKLEITEFRETVKTTQEYYDLLGWKEPKYGMSELAKQELINKL